VTLICLYWTAVRLVSTDYVRQTNGVNGGMVLFSSGLSPSVSGSVRSVPVNQTSLDVNGSSSKMVKASDFKFDVHVPRDSTVV